MWLEHVFGGDSPAHPLLLGQVAARAIVVYLIGLILVRLGKSRLLGSATALDVLLVVVLGSLLSRGINGTASVSGTTTACAVLVILHWLMTHLACRWPRLENLLKGHCRLLVDNGQVNREALRQSHLSLDDLLEELRLNANLEDLSRIDKAYKERSGQVSGVRRKLNAQVLDIGTDGGVKTVRLEVWMS